MYLILTPYVLIVQPIPRPIPSIRQNRPNQISIVDLSRTRINSLQQLIHLLITHLLPQIRQDVPQLPHADKAAHVLVEHLKPSAVLFWFAWIAEAAGSIEDLAE